MKILSTSWQTGGANALAPVIKRLKKLGVEIVVIGDDVSKKVFEKNEISCQSISDYGLDCASVESVGKLLDTEKPDLVLTGTNVRDEKHNDIIEQTVILAARKLDIRSLAVLDFWGIYKERFSDTIGNKDFIFLPDLIAVMDSYSKKDMIRLGFPENKLIVTGNPHFDELAYLRDNFTVEDRKKVRKDLGVGLDEYVILFASQPIEHYYGGDDSNPIFLGYTEKSVLEDLILSIDRLKANKMSFNLLVKAHPAEKKQDLTKIIEKHGKDYPVDQDYDTRKAVLASDLIVACFSTVGVEAVYMDKPVIYYQPGLTREDFLITNKIGASVPIYDKENLFPKLLEVTCVKSFQEELAEKRKDFSVDGKATERVVNLVYDMLK